ncbi:hypothetical protein [Phytoactinopolyspora limicola]|uniref:hypothetical protein n=1 Tax=Phytoactinopolyspora limicola TaxID=2715536 RepID=UPI001407A734|nr:hypothetical protein [Phytoactinopolyspora limicola]
MRIPTIVAAPAAPPASAPAALPLRPSAAAWEVFVTVSAAKAAPRCVVVVDRCADIDVFRRHASHHLDNRSGNRHPAQGARPTSGQLALAGPARTEAG